MDTTGVWCALYSDRSGLVVFETEIEVLRYAVRNTMEVVFVRFGEDPFDVFAQSQ